MGKRAAVTVLIFIGLMVVMEFVFPGHWDRLLTYFDGNLAAFNAQWSP